MKKGEKKSLPNKMSNRKIQERKQTNKHNSKQQTLTKEQKITRKQTNK